MAKKKSTSLTDTMYNKIALTHGKFEKIKGKGVKWEPADFAELKNIAAERGLEVTNKTSKADLVAFFTK